jgi:hypothetical protein
VAANGWVLPKPPRHLDSTIAGKANLGIPLSIAAIRSKDASEPLLGLGMTLKYLPATSRHAFDD